MTATWRLLVHEPNDGYSNMAIDEAILRAQEKGHCPPTIRFFRWQPACVSLGYFQSAEKEVDRDACKALGIDCVRRRTGGRAILHDAEVTYSVVAPEDDPRVSGTILESYRKISLALLTGLVTMGVAAVMKAPARPSLKDGAVASGDASEQRTASAACFDVPSEYEITVCGRKLVGSAQTRSRGALLQHGSLLLDCNAVQTFAVLKPPLGIDRGQAANWLSSRVTSLNDILGRSVTFDEAALALRTGFTRSFGVHLDSSELTREEHRAAERLREEKYAREEWNFRM